MTLVFVSWEKRELVQRVCLFFHNLYLLPRILTKSSTEITQENTFSSPQTFPKNGNFLGAAPFNTFPRILEIVRWLVEFERGIYLVHLLAELGQCKMCVIWSSSSKTIMSTIISVSCGYVSPWTVVENWRTCVRKLKTVLARYEK